MSPEHAGRTARSVWLAARLAARTRAAIAAGLLASGVISRRGLRRLTLTGLPAAMAVGGGFPMLVAHTAGPAASLSSRVLCRGWHRCSAAGLSSHDYAARGWRSYWRMSPGDQCTNYAAFVESTVFGVRTPSFLLGNGSQWAAAAAAHGVLVNHTPSVGAVAEWDAGAFGMGGFGHVAVVEAVGPHDSYIVISQQHIAAELNDYDWTLIKSGFPADQWQEWPNHFIHFHIPQRADVGYFNPRSHKISLADSMSQGPVKIGGQLGAGLVVPLVGDWRGDGSDSLGFYSPKNGIFHLLGARRSGRRIVSVAFRFGPPGMIPLVGDWKGIGRDGVGYYDPKTGTFSLRESLTPGPPYKTFRFGPPGMVPLSGDWNGGRRDGIGFYNPKTGVFHLRNMLSSGRAFRTFRFGPSHMIPLAGNWSGGRKEGVGFYDRWTGTFHVRDRLSNGPATAIFTFGSPRMVPFAGDWFGQPARH